MQQWPELVHLHQGQGCPKNTEIGNFKMLPRIVVTLVLGTPKHLELGPILQKWPEHCIWNFAVLTRQKAAQKKKKWKSANISMNEAIRSIQKLIPTFLENFRSVIVLSVISVYPKFYFWILKNGHFCLKSPKVPNLRHSKMALSVEWNNRYNFYTSPYWNASSPQERHLQPTANLRCIDICSTFASTKKTAKVVVIKELELLSWVHFYNCSRICQLVHRSSVETRIVATTHNNPETLLLIPFLMQEHLLELIPPQGRAISSLEGGK